MLVEKSKQTKPDKTFKAKASKTAMKRKNAMSSKEKKKIYRPTMINDVDTIERDVEIVESLLTDTDEEGIDATDDKDADWGNSAYILFKIIMHNIAFLVTLINNVCQNLSRFVGK